MTRTVTITVGWVVVLVVVVIVGTVWVVNHTTNEPTIVVTPTPWPQVTRTVDGDPTVVQPEDLDRNTS